MPELRITVSDPLGQTARRTVTVAVAPGAVPGDAAHRRRAGRPRHVRLGQILLEAGVLTQGQLQVALERQRQTGQRLGQVLLAMGVASQEQLAAALAQQQGLRWVRLAERPPDPACLLMVPEAVARQYQVVPLARQDQTLVLGMVDPLDVLAMDAVRRLTGLDVEPVVVTDDDVRRALATYPTLSQTVDEVIQAVEVTGLPEDAPDGPGLTASEAPVVRLANLIVLEAIRRRASDIHIEPQERILRVRFRVDGVLQVAMTLPVHLRTALVSRFKIMANMNIAERRAPQDGGVTLAVDGRTIDLRISTVPTVTGEKLVARILDRRAATVGIDQLGMQPPDLCRVAGLLARPHGIVLVTGPTGSGKTTTLYAMVHRLNRPEVNIVTIEDPVEYQLPGIAQVQVNPRAGLTFPVGLRAFLRQDPDVIMVGEIRDEETARIAVHAALTGHLVLSTLHTNDAASAVTRLTSMGIEPFLVASSLAGVLAQRLVRVLCEHCRRPVPGAADGAGAPSSTRVYAPAPAGCDLCHRTGYRGRVGVFEVMVIDDALRALIVRRAPADALRRTAQAAGMTLLLEDALAKVAAGVTSLAEVRRVLSTDDAALARSYGDRPAMASTARTSAP